ncbi:hypothetical protein PF006_g8001 [Phytophthora fragariae]|uniref:Uncharacterized protein n=1 Tax=Phytophthora fragariae TaxID=53985 RepID=A0A6A3U7U1_9STRA|nr:hypothetical protein PF006_g8001 [Phytophthora fragariae]
MGLFKHIHELLDTLAGLKGEDVVDRFDNGSRHSDETQNLSAVGSAVSQEAASALKMGFSIFYPTGIARSRLLWSIFDDCKITIPSMRTIILSDQLCKDSVMTEIFKCVPSYGLLKLGETFGEMHSENILGMDVFEIKTLMIMLLQRCSVEATNHLEDEAFTDFSMEPDCFLRLLHVLQTHYFSIVWLMNFVKLMNSTMFHLKWPRKAQVYQRTKFGSCLLLH